MTSGISDESRPSVPPNPSVRLVASSPEPTPTRTWVGACAQLTQGRLRGTVKLTGVAQSGVSSALVDTVCKLIDSGVDPAEIALVTTSKETASYHRRELAARLGGHREGFSTEGTLVRSVHSLAFAIVRAAHQRQGEPAPRLITGAEQDAVFRELLDGHREAGGAYWPPEHHEALALTGFARELRDFILRAQERALGPDDLIELGEIWNRPLWSAAGRFLREYEQTLALSGQNSFNASELTSEALRQLHDSDELCQAVARSTRYLLVDDAQLLDPQAAEVIMQLSQHAELMVLAGNLEQSVFQFRGAEPDILRNFAADHVIELDEPKVQAATTYVVAEDPRSHSDYIADVLRRAHLLEGVSWSDMAVIARDAGTVRALSRALLVAGVPVKADNTAMVLKEHPVVASMLIAARSLYERISTAELLELILGPVGGADPITLRRLLRGLRIAEKEQDGSRRALEVLEDIVLPLSVGYSAPDTASIREGLTERELSILERTTSVLAAGRTAYEAGESVETVLWEIWNASGVAQHLQAVSLRGGTAGAQADQDLDAAMALFDTAGDYTERRPGASLQSFVSYIDSLDVPSLTRERRTVRPDTVQILTAHSVVGMHVPLVVLAEATDELWPTISEAGTLFAQEELVDFIDQKIEPGELVSHIAERCAEEQRLFHLACSRATDRLIITTIDSPEADEPQSPSRFLADWTPDLRVASCTTQNEDGSSDFEMVPTRPRTLSTFSIVAELRRTLEDPNSSDTEAEHAAYHLAQLAKAGVPGADPSEWWGVGEVSTHEPLVEDGAPIRLSPSLLEAGIACPWSAIASRMLDSASTIHMVKGSLLHAFAEAVGNGVEPQLAEQLVTSAYEESLEAPPWAHEQTIEEFSRALAKTRAWIEKANATTTLLGTELRAKVRVGHLDEGNHDVLISGRVDRLDQTKDGIRVVDYKSGKSGAPSTNEALTHSQLASYQVALSHGALRNDGTIVTRNAAEQPLERGGGLLVYPAYSNNTAAVRTQPPLDDAALEEFTQHLMEFARAYGSPTVPVRLHPKTCDRCAVKHTCPLHDEGRSIVDAS